MSYSGGVFSINTSGQPVVDGTTISATVFNALTADLATGLSTCMLKDGTQTATAGIGFFAGTVSLPGIYFGTDTATGFYRIGLNNNGYAVNGTKLLDMTGTTLAVASTVTANTIGVTSGTTATVFNTTATTVNAFGAASVALNMGHASGTNTILGATTFSQALTASSTLAVSSYTLLNGATRGAGLGGSTSLDVLSTNNDTMTIKTDTAAAGTLPLAVWHTATAGDNNFVNFYTEPLASVALRGSITYNRGGGLTAYNTTSDYRSKTWNELTASAPLTLGKFHVVDGLMNGATIRRPMLIAHEAQTVAPWAVTGVKDAVNDKGEPIYQQLDHASMVPLVIAGWQNHEARIAKLEAILKRTK